MESFYTYNKETLLYEKVNVKKYLFWIYFPVVLAVFLNYFFFRAEIIKEQQWVYKEGKLVKENVNLTLEEWIGKGN